MKNLLFSLLIILTLGCNNIVEVHFKSLFTDEKDFKLSEILQIQKDRFALAVNLLKVEQELSKLSKKENRKCWETELKNLDKKIKDLILRDYNP